MEIGHLPLKRDIDGQLQLVGTGPVDLRIDYDRVLGVGGQGVVFRGALTSVVTGMLVAEVRGGPCGCHACLHWAGGR